MEEVYLPLPEKPGPGVKGYLPYTFGLVPSPAELQPHFRGGGRHGGPSRRIATGYGWRPAASRKPNGAQLESWSLLAEPPVQHCMDIDTMRTAAAVPIFHKGDQRECSKYRRCPCSCPGKVYPWVLDRSVPLWFKPQIQEEHHHFWIRWTIT